MRAKVKRKRNEDGEERKRQREKEMAREMRREVETDDVIFRVCALFIESMDS